MIGILWNLFIAISLIGSVVLSGWGVWKIYHELKSSEAFRTRIEEQVKVVHKEQDEILVALTTEPDEPEDLDVFRDGLKSIETQMEALPDRIRARLDGALGRAKRAATEEEEKFTAGLNAAVDEQFLAHLPPLLRGIGVKVLESGNPIAMDMFRQWALARPEAQSHFTQLQSGVPPQASSPASPLDQYVTP